MTKKIAFFGNERLATGITTKGLAKQALLDNGYDVSVIGKDSKNIEKELRLIKPDIGVLVAYGLIIPKEIINIPDFGIINIHPSLLPEGRGPSPIEEVILSGSKQTGVSIMSLVEKMDEGPVLVQQKVKLAGNEHKQELADSLLDLGSQLLIKCLSDIFSGNANPVPQSKTDVTYTHKIQKSDGIIDWKKTAAEVEREIRAYAGWPRSRAKINNVDCIVIDADITDNESKPGHLKVDKNHLSVGCATGSLSIKKLQPAGKRPMSANEFIRGYIK
ncbi:MAG TPA: methionyl-tRNA formyltransferase [Candidatus Saccharimonadales bacterium]|nr:methionyl-tRNA formyltransferase [Candidatus Saccharimonadales bacterium]